MMIINKKKELDQSFNEIIFSNFRSRSALGKTMNLTCYIYLKCETALPCLDWRHICFIPYRYSLLDYVCYDEQLCADFLQSTRCINGSTCRHLDEFELNTTNSINTMLRTT